ncbi:uncharacterized protein [Henckelia pumila]|uniref:uncharacterized protein n=1 Tax=Henckelia pumila TaxID=405737 RepID=UPI003C6DBF9D
MNLIIWNARGIENPRAFWELGRLIAEKCLTLLFFSEKKMREVNCRWWKFKLGFSGSFMVDCNGKSGGLALFWKSPAIVSVKSFSQGHIDCIIQEDDVIWKFTGFYGHPEAALRRISWDLLQRLKAISELRDFPWLVGGDFNEICYDSEKLGGNRKSPSHLQAFRDTLELCALQDISCFGEFFTWVNRRESNHAIFERLDRFVGNLGWRLMFPTARVESLEFYHSDHRPLCLKLYGDQARYSDGSRN